MPSRPWTIGQDRCQVLPLYSAAPPPKSTAQLLLVLWLSSKEMKTTFSRSSGWAMKTTSGRHHLRVDNRPRARRIRLSISLDLELRRREN